MCMLFIRPAILVVGILAAACSSTKQPVASAADAGTPAAIAAPASKLARQLKQTVAVLAHDSMQGRMSGTPGIEKAAQYLEREFKQIGLKPWPGSGSGGYRQNFAFAPKRASRVPAGTPLFNVIGLLPGKSRPNEYIIFSAHYDHIGTRGTRPASSANPNDSIFNGADDDASGVAAMLAVARYWARKGGNERSLLFIGFTAEEIGLVGSEHFGTTVNSEQIVAMVNIEMIGMPNPIGAYLTGFEKTNLGTLLQSRMPAELKLGPDPYPAQNLFLRSDNASLARLGVPAHTFSTAPMETHKTYHQLGDEVETLDYNHMARVTTALITATAGLVQATDTPNRVAEKDRQ